MLMWRLLGALEFVPGGVCVDRVARLVALLELLRDCWPVWLLLPVPFVLLTVCCMWVDRCFEHNCEDVPVPCNGLE